MAKNENAVKDRITALISNQPGLAPDGVIFTITNEHIENLIESTFRENGIKMDDDNIAVRAIYNPKYDQVIKSKKKAEEGIVPFDVFVGVKVSKKDRKNGKGFDISIGNENNGANDLLRKLSGMANQASCKMQFSILGEEDLNKAISLFKNSNKIKWETASKKQGIMKVQLDADLIIEKLLCLDLAPNSRFNIDIISVKKFGGEDQKFAMKILKSYQTQTFKKSKSSFAKYLTK